MQNRVNIWIGAILAGALAVGVSACFAPAREPEKAAEERVEASLLPEEENNRIATGSQEKREGLWEAEYVPKEEGFHAVGVPRHNFWLTIPGEWRAYSSRSADGYFLDCGNESVDVRTYGSHHMPELWGEEEGAMGYPYASEDALLEEFEFDSGLTGVSILEEGESVMYLYVEDGRDIYFTVDFRESPEWYGENEELVRKVAATLRDGMRVLEDG